MIESSIGGSKLRKFPGLPFLWLLLWLDLIRVAIDIRLIVSFLGGTLRKVIEPPIESSKPQKPSSLSRHLPRPNLIRFAIDVYPMVNGFSADSAKSNRTFELSIETSKPRKPSGPSFSRCLFRPDLIRVAIDILLMVFLFRWTLQKVIEPSIENSKLRKLSVLSWASFSNEVWSKSRLITGLACVI